MNNGYDLIVVFMEMEALKQGGKLVGVDGNVRKRRRLIS